MRVAVLGYGAIARRHLDILRGMDFGEPLDVTILRARRLPLNEEHAWCRVAFEMQEILDFAPQAAIVASPASEHIRQGQLLADIGADLLIEKPLSIDLAGIDELIELCDEKKLVFMVGYNLAFLDALNEFIQDVHKGGVGDLLTVEANVGQYLPDWRRTDYRSSVSADASLGGGVIMELSHELEYVDRLIGGTDEIFCFSGKSGLLEMNAEDCADIVMRNSGGILAHVHMDMLQKEPVRACTVFGSAGRASLDMIPAPGDRNKMYEDQLAHFFECRKGTATPRVSGLRGRRVMELILAAKESAEKGIKVTV